MSKDTYRGDLAVPQSLNQYAYVMNNPINYVDPTGHIHVYSSGELEGWSRDSLKSLLVDMGVYWNADKEKFEETGVWTQQQEDAHANADLIRELIPYSFEFISSSSQMSSWHLDNKSEYLDRIEYDYSATKTITDVYKNNFETKYELSYEYYSKTEVKSAAQVAAGNQTTIEADYGAVKAAWNNEPTIKLVRTEHKTNLKSDKTLVKNTQILTSDNNHTNVNKDILIKNIEKSGVIWKKDQTKSHMSDTRTLLDRLNQAGSGVLDVIGGTGQVALGVGVATGGTAASGGLLGGVAVVGGGSIAVVGGSNIMGGIGKIADAFTSKDINELIANPIEYVASKNGYTKTLYKVVDITSGLASTYSGLKTALTQLKNGGHIVDMAFSTLKDKKILRDFINVSDKLSIVGQRGKNAYVVLDKSINAKTALNYVGTVTGVSQGLDWLKDKLFQ